MEPSEYLTLFRQEERFWWYRGLHRLAEDRLREAFGTIAPVLLDAGCGTGGLLARLTPRTRGFGLDFSPIALGYARQRSERPLTRGSVTRLPFRDASFDGIVSLDVIYHRGVESDATALREFRRCLRPGGALLLNLPAYESLRSSHDLAIHTARRYRRAQLRALLVEAGLLPVRITHWNTLLFPGLALVRTLRRGRGRGPDAQDPPPSDVTALPGILDPIFGAALALERAWLRHADLPFGLSLMAVARRPPASCEDPA